MALGYYSRNVTSPKRGVLRIFVRRFRCCECGKTVSVLPSFVQPYRLVLNLTINEFFERNPQHQRTFLAPAFETVLEPILGLASTRLTASSRSVVAASRRLDSDAAGWWKVIAATFGDLEKITNAGGPFWCHPVRSLSLPLAVLQGSVNELTSRSTQLMYFPEKRAGNLSAQMKRMPELVLSAEQSVSGVSLFKIREQQAAILISA